MKRARHGHDDALRRYLAELVGTFILVVGGVGTAVLAGLHVGTLGVSIAFGLSVLAMTYTLGPISGAHLNPAVTFGLALAGKLDRGHVPGYVAAQIVGAVAGAGVVLYIAGGLPSGYSPAITGFATNGFEAHSPSGFSVEAAFAAETLLTFVLVLTVLGATSAEAPVGFAGLAIGIAYTLVHLVGTPVTNTSVNPARSIGPALYVGGWALSQLWLFLAAPLLGGACAAGLYRVLHGRARITSEAAERDLEPEPEPETGLAVQSGFVA